MKSINTILAVLALTVSSAAFANSATTTKVAAPVESAVAEGSSPQADASAKPFNKRDKHAKRVATHKSYKTK
jgi:hypothetical protein